MQQNIFLIIILKLQKNMSNLYSDDQHIKSQEESQDYDSNSQDNDYPQQQSHDEQNQSNQPQQQSHSQSSRQSKSGSSQQSDEDLEFTEQQNLQLQIIKIVQQNQKASAYQKQITAQIFDKIKTFGEVARTKNGQQLITIRIQELVLNKLLVLTYNKSEFRLILSHYNLGRAYLVNDCIQQAIQHISVALHKNQKLFNELPETQLLQTYMQNSLASALMKKQNYQDAIQLLTASIQCQDRLKQHKKLQENSNQDKNTKTLILLSKCYAKIKQFQMALKIVDQVLNICKKKKMAREQYAFAMVEKANILAEQQNFAQAVNYQQTAIDLLMEQNYGNPQDVAQMYSILSGYHEKLGNTQNSLTCIQKVKALYQQLYSGEDKRVIKTRRKIATNLLKSERFKQAVNELLQIVQLQEKVFGQSSLQTARTLKLLGTVYISLQIGDARAYLKRAMNIFSSHGNKKQVVQIKNKLKILMTGSGNNNIDPKILSEQQL